MFTFMMDKKKIEPKKLVLVVIGTILWFFAFLGLAIFVLPMFGSIGKFLTLPLFMVMLWLPFRIIDGKSLDVISHGRK